MKRARSQKNLMEVWAEAQRKRVRSHPTSSGTESVIEETGTVEEVEEAGTVESEEPGTFEGTEIEEAGTIGEVETVEGETGAESEEEEPAARLSKCVTRCVTLTT